MNWNRYQGLKAYFLYQELIVVVSEFHSTGKSYEYLLAIAFLVGFNS